MIDTMRILDNPFSVGREAVLSPGCYPGLQLANAFGVNEESSPRFTYTLFSFGGRGHMASKRLDGLEFIDSVRC